MDYLSNQNNNKNIEDKILSIKRNSKLNLKDIVRRNIITS